MKAITPASRLALAATPLCPSIRPKPAASAFCPGFDAWTANGLTERGQRFALMLELFHWEIRMMPNGSEMIQQ